MKRENHFRIFGVVNKQGTQQGVPGLRVQALDKDLFFDDRLGSAKTDSNGRFEIRYTEHDFNDFFESRPDIYLKIIDADGTERFTTEDKVRYEADDTEGFVIELPPVVEPIGSTAALIQRLLDDESLLAQLSEAVAGPLQQSGLLAADLAFTLAPLVYKRPKRLAAYHIAALGPQPEPPDSVALMPRMGRFSDELSPLVSGKPLSFRWWIGLPSVEILQWLEEQRLSDIPVAEQTGVPTRVSSEFANRIMADKSLLTQLSATIQRLFSKHGLVMKAGLDYLFTPVVYERPTFKGEVFAPQLIDSALSTAGVAPGWINPVDGVMPPYLHQQLHG